MPLPDFQDRVPDSAEGRFYVTHQCLDCDLCRETAPAVFARMDEFGYSFVKKQPESDDEMEQAIEAMEGCPCEAILSDGDTFDWKATPLEPRYERDRTDRRKPCKHCGDGRPPKPWWKFW